MARKKRRHPTRRDSSSTDKVYGFILQFYDDPENDGKKLTYKAISEFMKWRSRNTAYYHVQKWVEKGKVVTDGGEIRLTR